MYYISRVLIPPLERIFNLIGADVRSWYDEMAKPLRADEAESLTMTPHKPGHQLLLADRPKIEEHFYGTRCLTCDSPTQESMWNSSDSAYLAHLSKHFPGICDDCRVTTQETISGLLARIHRTEERVQNTHSICVSCSGVPHAEPIDCESLDCPWLYERKKVENKAEQLGQLQQLVEELSMEEEITLDEWAHDDDDDVSFSFWVEYEVRSS